MGIYIKNMKMPKDDETIKFVKLLNGKMVAVTSPTKGVSDINEVIEVTEPHGDLIDRERIDYKNYKMHDGRGNLIVSDTFVDGVTWVDNCIYDTPTVIEAEGE